MAMHWKFATQITQPMVNFLNTPNKEQIDRFKKAARDAEADTSDDALDKIMRKLDLKKKPEPKDDKKD